VIHDPRCVHAQLYLHDILLALYPSWEALSN
jgi:hypothetical protein